MGDQGIVREPAVGFIMWLRPKGLKVYSYVEKYAEFENQSLKKLAGTQCCYGQRNTLGVTSSEISLKMGVYFTPASNLTYLAPPGQLFMGAKLFSGTPRCIKNVSNKFIWAMLKCMVAMANRNAILKNGGLPTKSIISQLLLTIDYLTWYQIELYQKTHAFPPMIRDTNYLICIFMNINENLKNKGKSHKTP